MLFKEMSFIFHEIMTDVFADLNKYEQIEKVIVVCI